MNCPRCRDDLNQTQRSGIEIDFCPRCRGVWLDGGELEKLIERSTNDPYSRSSSPTHGGSQERDYHRPDERYGRDREQQDSDRHYKKKKKGFFGRALRRFRLKQDPASLRRTFLYCQQLLAHRLIDGPLLSSLIEKRDDELGVLMKARLESLRRA